MIFKKDPELQIKTQFNQYIDFILVNPWSEDPANLWLDFWLTELRSKEWMCNKLLGL